VLTHYLAYLTTGAFYFGLLSALSSIAVGIDTLPILAALGSILLAGVAAPLSILRHRFASAATLVAVALLLPWVAGVTIEIVRSPSEPSLLAIPVAVPGLLVLLLGVRTVLRPPVSRLQIPRAFRLALAAPPACVALAILSTIGWRLS